MNHDNKTSLTEISYVMSLLLPSGVSQLAAIFFILIQMMFSGSNPTLQQLQNNQLIGKITIF